MRCPLLLLNSPHFPGKNIKHKEPGKPSDSDFDFIVSFYFYFEVVFCSLMEITAYPRPLLPLILQRQRRVIVEWLISQHLETEFIEAEIAQRMSIRGKPIWISHWMMGTEHIVEAL